MGDYPGWHADGALNFAHEEVCQYKLNLIREQCELFNLDGLELDFMRFLFYFPYGKGRDYLDVMTEFVRKARATADEVGEQRGRKILLAVRVPPRIDLCLDKGLDVQTWANENLIDVITVAAHWIDDPALPVSKFKKDLGEVDLPVYASLESGQYHPREFCSHGMYWAAAHCLNQGADGICLFNFFSIFETNKCMSQEVLYCFDFGGAFQEVAYGFIPVSRVYHSPRFLWIDNVLEVEPTKKLSKNEIEKIYQTKWMNMADIGCIAAALGISCHYVEEPKKGNFV